MLNASCFIGLLRTKRYILEKYTRQIPARSDIRRFTYMDVIKSLSSPRAFPATQIPNAVGFKTEAETKLGS